MILLVFALRGLKTTLRMFRNELLAILAFVVLVSGENEMRMLVVLALLGCLSAPTYGDEQLRKIATKLVDQHACAVLPHLLTAENNAVYFTMPSIVVGAAIREGAAGETRDEWDKVLGLKDGEEAEVKRLADFIASQESFHYRSGSAVFLPPTAQVLPSYLRYVRRMHGAEVRPVDFGNPAHVAEMNRWFKANSGIDDVLKEGELARNTEIVISSACKLDVDWASKMTRTTDTFYGDGDPITTDFAEGEYEGLKRGSFAGHEVIVNGDTALHIAPWSMSGTGPNGAAVEQSGLSVAVLRRQADGGWKMVIDNPHGQMLLEN